MKAAESREERRSGGEDRPRRAAETESAQKADAQDEEE